MVLALSTAGARDEAITLLGDVHRQIAGMLQDVRATTSPLVARLGLLGALCHVVERELPDTFTAVSWAIAPPAEEQLQRLPPLRAEVLFYAAREAIRNAACHRARRRAERPRPDPARHHDGHRRR